jgi:hypothetical protein
MVYVRLAQGWTDSAGTDHAAGSMVDVDAATLAELEATGVVAESDPPPNGGDNETDGSWVGPSGGSTDGSWVGPSDNKTDGSWVGPSGSGGG